jgi:hypothetical protein
LKRASVEVEEEEAAAAAEVAMNTLEIYFQSEIVLNN